MKDKRIYANFWVDDVNVRGIALCYNWVKECGAVWLAKPDLHIQRVVDAIINHDYGSWENFISQRSVYAKYETIKRKPMVYNEERVALFMWEWAKQILESGADSNISAYKLDRILYLYCTNGRFYLDENKNGSISETAILNMIYQK
ncbi:MAG: hypothetical protein PUB76_07685 [Oscillospiraceae bacterium]|nr:hypothetical protein [Oscillospiraceae bacterium]